MKNTSEDTLNFKDNDILGHAEDYIVPFVFVEIQENNFLLKYPNGIQSIQSTNSNNILNEILDHLRFPSEVVFLVKSYKHASTIADHLYLNSDESSIQSWFYIMSVQQRLLNFDSMVAKIQKDGLDKYKMINTQKYLSGELPECGHQFYGTTSHR